MKAVRINDYVVNYKDGKVYVDYIWKEDALTPYPEIQVWTKNLNKEDISALKKEQKIVKIDPYGEWYIEFYLRKEREMKNQDKYIKRLDEVDKAMQELRDAIIN